MEGQLQTYEYVRACMPWADQLYLSGHNKNKDDDDDNALTIVVIMMMIMMMIIIGGCYCYIVPDVNMNNNGSLACTLSR